MMVDKYSLISEILIKTLESNGREGKSFQNSFVMSRVKIIPLNIIKNLID